MDGAIEGTTGFDLGQVDSFLKMPGVVSTMNSRSYLNNYNYNNKYFIDMERLQVTDKVKKLL